MSGIATTDGTVEKVMASGTGEDSGEIELRLKENQTSERVVFGSSWILRKKYFSIS
jgi:hypothetical protein